MAPPRNAVWFLSDQHRGQAMSCAGDPNVSTPNMDRLAVEGVRFGSAVSGFPLCCPARGSILTGRYPHRCVPGHQFPLPGGMPTVADAFREAGHDTAWFGKWHLDGFDEATGRADLHHVPRGRRGGFGTWIGYENNNAPFDARVHGHRTRGDGTVEEVDRFRLGGFETDALTDLLIEHLEAVAASGRSFFAAVSVQPPHDPYAAPADWMRRHRPAGVQLRGNVPPIEGIRERARRDLAGYHALIENVDHNLGKVRAALERLGLTDDTHVVYFSDHGDQHGSHGHERKSTPYQESIHVPFLVGGPCHRHYGLEHETDAVLNMADVAPTTLGLCGLDVPAGMTGHDHSGLLAGKGSDAYRDAVAALPEETLLQNVEPFPHPPGVTAPWRGILTRDRWKYVCFAGAPYLMFDLEEDPLEWVNLAHHGHAAAKRRELHARLAALLERLDDPFELPDPG